jgi:Bacterial SH3 domain
MQTGLRLRSIFIVLASIALLVGPSLTRAANPVTDLVVGVYSDNPVKLYARPTLAGTVVQNAAYGARMTWTGATQQADNRNWMQVNYLGVTGWASPDTNTVYLVDPNQVTPGINPAAVVQPMQRPITLYQSPSVRSPVLGQLPVGAQLTVTDGPVIADFYNWWQVKVSGPNTQGWLPDTGGDNLQTVQPLKVYGIDVCDNFKIKIFGATGWDSIMKVLPDLIPSREKIICLASSNLAGNNTPFVTVLTRIEGQNPNETQDTVRIFMARSPDWLKVFEASSDTYSRTVDLTLFDLTGNHTPAILWTMMADGTGHVLTVRALRYHPVAGLQQIFFADSLYKGGVQVSGTGSLVVTQADYKDNEPNCCQTGIERWAYVWQNNEFVQVVNDRLLNPGALQGFPPQ